MTKRAISAKDLDAARAKISAVVEETVVETFTTMFGQDVTADGVRKMNVASGHKSVYSAVKLHQGDVHVEFCFHFDFDLLFRVAALLFTPEDLEKSPVHEDVACEIANIVCSKVKAFLNEEGFGTEMGFPYVPEHEENHIVNNPDMVHMHFYYDGAHKDGRDVGVVVNFFTDGKGHAG